MNAESILADIDHGIHRDDVTAFRFRKGRALTLASLFALTGFGVLGIAVALAPSLNPNAGAGRYSSGPRHAWPQGQLSGCQIRLTSGTPSGPEKDRGRSRSLANIEIEHSAEARTMNLK
jgi:hypothetical protein